MLDTAVELVKHSTDSLVQIKDNYVQVKETVEQTSIKWNVEPTVRHKCIKGTKNILINCVKVKDFRIQRKSFKISVFYGYLDIMIAQLSHRFKGLRLVAENVSIIFPKNLLAATDKELYDGAITSVKKHEKDLSK
jgi:hypothetical protein